MLDAPPSKKRRLGHTWVRTVQGLWWSLPLAWGWGAAMPTVAAQRVTVRVGPLEQVVAVADLERFTKTGILPPALQLYAPVLTPQVREVLNSHLQLAPGLGNQLIDELLRSSMGKRLVASLATAIPSSTLPQLQTAVLLAVRQANGLSVVSFLRAYPAQNVTVNASSALLLALQFNSTYWQSQVLGPLLGRELTATSTTFFQPTFDPAVRGQETVHQQTITLQDRQRHRTILVDLYWGRGVQPHARMPLVVISHGFGADRKFLAYLARHLASHGLSVAAIEHPASNVRWLASVSSSRTNLYTVPVMNVQKLLLLPATEFVDRPKDVSFVLDKLARLNQRLGPLQGKFNTQQVSVVGHSLGGYTALALAGAEVNLQELRQFCKSDPGAGLSPSDWLECAAADLPNAKLKLRDQRVVSVLALNPLVGHLFGKTGLYQVATPVLLLAGTEDALTPFVSHQLRPFTALRCSKYLLAAIGGTHLSIGDPASVGGQVMASTLVKERRGEETKSLRQLLQGVSLAFIKQLTPEAKIYQPFLTPAYTQSFSTPALPLRFSTELPKTTALWILALDSNWGLLINISGKALFLVLAATGLTIMRRRFQRRRRNKLGKPFYRRYS